MGRWRSYDGNVMGIGSEHKVEESACGSTNIGVEFGTGDVVGGLSSGEAIESSSGVGDDGGDSDKIRARSITIGR